MIEERNEELAQVYKAVFGAAAEPAPVAATNARRRDWGERPAWVAEALDRRIRACSGAGVGERSDADFALAAFAVEQGFSPDEVWPQVQDAGKFAERGRKYFDMTWAAAAERTGPKLYVGRTADGWSGTEPAPEASQGEPEGQPAEVGDGAPVRFRNYEVVEIQGEDGKGVKVKKGLSAGTITRAILGATGGWPKRVDNCLFAPGPDYSVQWLGGTDALFAWVSRTLGRHFNSVDWSRGSDRLTQGQFYASLTQTAEAFDAVEAYPHEPRLPRHHYLHPATGGGDGTALSGLVKRFCPASDIDEDLIKALFLTSCWGGEPGTRPAFLIEADDGDASGGRGFGKTRLAMAAAEPVGGYIAVRPQDEMEGVITRLLSPDAMGARFVLLDNLKTLKFSWADLEGLLTSAVISGKRMYHGEGRRPNTLTWVITGNNASLSKDMAARCVIIRLKKPPYDPAWEEQTLAYIRSRRWDIIGDILAELARPGAELKQFSRWGSWERQVLSKVAEPTDCQKVIAERQEAVDSDQEEADLVREGFVGTLRHWKHNPDKAVVRITSREAAEILSAATDEKRPVNKASGYLKTLPIRELRKSDRGDAKGWVWHGSQAPVDAKAVPLKGIAGDGEGWQQ